MKKIISLLIIFFILLWTTFAYNPTIKDQEVLNNVYLKIDKIKPGAFQKLYNQVNILKLKYQNKPQVYYLLSELWNYVKSKIDLTILYEVTKVVDWDTIEINYNWENTSLRLIWIDAPESYVTRFWYKECFWDEASKYLKEFLTWKKVSIEFDKTQWEKDKYWRLLVYIMYNWENINAKLLEEGYAFEYTYETSYKYQIDFKKYQSESKELNKGLWNHNTCNWERKNVSTEQNISTDYSIKYYNPNNLNYLDMGFNCNKTKYCKYMDSCDEVKYYFYQCKAWTFDGDKDWIPCEDLCGSKYVGEK